MATTGNERYLRHTWLLGEGGLLVLRGIVTRETALSGQPLETILASKRSLFTNILKEQKLTLFPTSSTVNQDVSTWDISLLLIVIKKIFWSNLSAADQSSIEILKTYRNKIHGHPTILSMGMNEYDTNRALVEAALRQVSIGLGAHNKSEIEDIIQKSASGDIDIGSVLGRIKDLLEFETTFKSLENKINYVYSTLSGINSSLRDMAVSSTRDFCETKDEQKRVRQIVSDMAKLNKRFILDQTRRQTAKELETIVQAHCDDKEKEEKAIKLLYSVVDLIQSGRQFSEAEIKTMILQRIRWHGEVTVKLIEDVISWFMDIHDNPDTSVGIAHLGSIRLPIKCFSNEGKLRHIDYMNGSKGQGHLLEISSNMSQQLGFLCILSWSVVPERHKIFQPSYELSKSSKIFLPIQTTTEKGFQKILNKFDGTERNVHLLTISETLSDIFGAKIGLTASVDRNSFQAASLDTGLQRLRSKVRLRQHQFKPIEMMTDTSETTRRRPPLTIIGSDEFRLRSYEKKETKPAMEWEKRAYIPEEKLRDKGKGRSQEHGKKEIKSKNQDEKLAYSIIDRAEETVMKTDTTETRRSFFSSLKEFLLRPFKPHPYE